MKTWAEINDQGKQGRFGPRWIKAACVIQGQLRFTGPRHDILIREIIAKKYLKHPKSAEAKQKRRQGFVDNAGNFLTREEAANLAKYNGQVSAAYPKKQIISQDLWEFLEPKRSRWARFRIWWITGSIETLVELVEEYKDKYAEVATKYGESPKLRKVSDELLFYTDELQKARTALNKYRLLL